VAVLEDHDWLKDRAGHHRRPAEPALPHQPMAEVRTMSWVERLKEKLARKGVPPN
jgi:hypothetical protein